MSNINCFRRRSKNIDYPIQDENVLPNEIIKDLNRVHCISFGSHLTIIADNKVISYKDERLCDKYLQFQRIYLVQPVHYSLCYGKKNCFRIITKEDSGDHGSIIFPCLSQQDRNNQIKELLEQTKILNNQYMVEETSVHLVIQEARNLSTKNKYYCELKLDDIVYARTTVKKMYDMLIWCEKFDLKGLPKINLISVTIWKLANAKEKIQSPQIVSQVNISTEGIDRYTVTEKWYSPSPILKPSLVNANPVLKFSASCDLDNTPPDQAVKPLFPTNATTSMYSSQQTTTIIRDTAPLLRIACRYFPLSILPEGCYARLLCFLQDNGCEFLRNIELLVTAKFREELVRPIVQLASYNSVLYSVHNNHHHHQYWIESLIAQLVCSEAGNNDINLILRGNSMGSKAIECFLKMESQQYLEIILSETIQEVQKNYLEMEIDPSRLIKSKSSSSSNTKSVSSNALKKRQRKLEIIVSKVLRKIFDSIQFIPSNVLRVFNEIRCQILVNTQQNNYKARVNPNKEDYINKVVSGCFFLRLVCPAIMTPYLFNLLPDYSENREIHRAFTLVAKSVQNVANFASIDEMKEEYMKEMVLYCRQYYSTMSGFLSNLSSSYNPNTNNTSTNNSMNRVSVSYHGDLVGYESSRLCHHLEYVMKNPKYDNVKRSSLELQMLDIINEIRKKEADANIEQVNTIDKIKHNLRQQVFSNYKQLEMSTKSSGYFSTLNGSHSGLSNIDSLFRAQQSENNTTTDLLELEKQKLDIIKGMSETYRFYNDFDIDEEDINKTNVPLNVDDILETRCNFLLYVSYSETAILNCFNTEYLRDNHEQLVQIMKLNSEIQIRMMKNLNN